jgi:hypothetical protein
MNPRSEQQPRDDSSLTEGYLVTTNEAQALEATPSIGDSRARVLVALDAAAAACIIGFYCLLLAVAFGVV